MTMDLATVTMSRAEAAELLEEYRERLAFERTTQDERVAAGYRALARGLPVLKLSETVRRGGWHPNGLPRIAIVRAGATTCTVSTSGTDLIYYGDEPDWHLNRGALVNQRTVRVPASRPARPAEVDYRTWRSNGRAMVPSIPPRHRPNRNRLARFHILWEVDQWELVPPHDPALLRHIGGDLWAVMATWDLTELERAVLGAG